jgi:hypothetical protein
VVNTTPVDEPIADFTVNIDSSRQKSDLHGTQVSTLKFEIPDSDDANDEL